MTKENLPTALITGASYGIGYELSRLFAADGYRLAFVARSADRLEQIKAELISEFGIEVLVIPKDLTLPSAPLEIFEEVRKSGISINVLVNNAGFGLHGLFSETDLQTELNMIQLNISALTHLTKLFLKDMLLSNHGKILNVASVAAFISGPLMAVYYATKAYVLSFSEALRTEFKGSGVTVSALCPGPSATKFATTAQLDNSRLFESGLLRTMEAATVARIGYRGLMRGKPVIITGLMNRLMVQLLRVSPRALIRNLTFWIMKKR